MVQLELNNNKGFVLPTKFTLIKDLSSYPKYDNINIIDNLKLRFNLLENNKQLKGLIRIVGSEKYTILVYKPTIIDDTIEYSGCIIKGTTFDINDFKEGTQFQEYHESDYDEY